MKKLFISITAFVLTVTLIAGGALFVGNPYAVPGAKAVPGAAPMGALVLDNQSELVMRSDQAYTPEKSSPIDLTGYKLVFSEEFEGDAIDESVWSVYHGPAFAARAGIRTSEYTRVKDGKLYMPIKLVDYELNGETIKTWAIDDIQLKQTYSFGYFEFRAIMPKAHNGSGGFWMQSPQAYTDGVAPRGGAEIDICESQCYKGSHIGSYGNDPQIYEVNIHYNSEANRQKLRAHGIKVPGADMYENFHTYGVLWTPKWYVFYVDGLAAYKTTFGVAGPEADEYVRLSTDLRGGNYQKASDAFVENDDTDMIVDYVKIWQLDDPADYPDFESAKAVSFINDLITRVFAFFDRVADFFRKMFHA